MNFLTFINGVRTFVRNIDFIDISNNAFRIRLTGTATADRTINMPDDTGVIQLQDRPIGSLGTGVSLRGYEPIVTVSASKTLTLSDAGTIQNCTGGSATVITIPLDSAVPYPIGTRIILKRTMSPQLSIALAGGVSAINELGSALGLSIVYSSAVLRKTNTNTWSVEFPINNSVFMPGDPNTTTQTINSNNTRLANTAYADRAVSNLSKIRYLFVIAGESNAGGLAVNSQLTSSELLSQTHVKIWNNTTSVFQPLQIGSNNLISHSTLTNNITHGIERGLSRELLKVLQWPEAYILKSGQGGSTIAQWSVGNASGYLTTLTNRYNSARTALTTAGFTVVPIFIWFNGINDAIAGTVPATFRTATQAHFTQIRSLMGANTPIFFPKIMPTNAAYTAINTEIQTIDTADANLWSLESETIPNNPADPNHYTANGYMEIARMFVDSLRGKLGIAGTFGIGQARSVSSNPIFSARRSTVLSIPSDVPTLIPLDTLDIDTDTMFRPVDGKVAIPIGCDGIYILHAMTTIEGCFQVWTRIYVNNAIRAQSPVISLSADNCYGAEVYKILRLSVGDVVDIRVFQSNTANSAKNILLNLEFQATLNMYRIGL